MRCPFCKELSNYVVDSRLSKDGVSIRRRRECQACERRFTTYERVEEILLYVQPKPGQSIDPQGLCDFISERAAALSNLGSQLLDIIATGIAWRATAGALSTYGLSAEPAALSLIREVFWMKIVVVEDSHASGDAVIDALATSAPAGAVVRAMSVQNIKGTGLDFVYRWVYGRPLLDEVSLLGAVDAVRTENILAAIERHHEWSVPLAREVLAVIDAQPPTPELSRVRALVQAEMDRREKSLASGPQRTGTGWTGVVSRAAWTLWDPLDAILRRRIADRLFQDLADHRISHARCAHELRKLTERGK